MDADIAELVAAERLADAAMLATTRGAHRVATDLYERACLFGAAAESALRDQQPDRALLLACLGSDDDAAERALTAITGETTLARVALTLGQRGHHVWAARALENAGRAGEAAAAWAIGGRADRAAELLERLGEPIAAARELEAALRATPDRHDLRLLLGRLLLRHGRIDGAVRVLQGIEASAPERASALAELVRAFEMLGLRVAAADAKEELERLGGPASARAPTRASDRPPPAADSNAGARARLYGRYEVVREVSSTASARVLECLDVLTHETIALKIFAGTGLRGVGRDALARFEREVAILRALRHPNVVPLRGYIPEAPALALSWMPGGSLADMLAGDMLAPARAVEIAAAVLDALAAAHRAGVIHRDVKPSNVLFDGAGAARLSDFGAAHLGDLAATATAGVIGTFSYMSPEQREGRPATIRSDLYSVGVMLREMLTGRPPGEATRIQPSAAHRELGAAHDALVAELTSAEPDERPRDALEARRALLALHWPEACEPIARPAPSAPAEPATQERLEPLGGDSYFDRWTGRRLRIVALTPRALARARAFALAHSDNLDGILRVDTDQAQIWIEELAGRALDRPLAKAEAAALERALAALHEAGVAHGHVDPAHVRLSDRFGPILRYEPDAAPTATPDLDRIALAQMR